ncbi:MAG: hypothetical protein IT424_12300 [Pirellulales bacterium]|nr:hypothetical protein [Pirellulales bacterium]
MTEIIVPVPDDLKLRAEAAARHSWISLAEFVCQCIAMTVDERLKDPMFAGLSVFYGDAPSDLSVRTDAYLYGEDS